MALVGGAAMVLLYDIEGDSADHDDWHSAEHFHERLSVPGFLRATRWVATDAAPRYLVTYEVSGTDIATSPAYLARLNAPSAWTSSMMPRFRGMVRGFAHVVASAGFGMGAHALAIRFTPDRDASERIGGMLPKLVASRGMAGAHLLVPEPPPPMTREQALRGRDTPLPWLVLATAYDAAALDSVAALLTPGALGAEDVTQGRYALHHTASAEEVARNPQAPAHAPRT